MDKSKMKTSCCVYLMVNLFVSSTLTPIHYIFTFHWKGITFTHLLCIRLLDTSSSRLNRKTMLCSWTWLMLTSLVKEIIQNSDLRRDCFSYCSLTSQIVCLPLIQSFLYGDENVDWGWISSLVCMAETGV